MSGCLLGLVFALFFIFISVIINIVRLLTGVKRVAKNFVGTKGTSRENYSRTAGPWNTNNNNAHTQTNHPDYKHPNHRGPDGRFFEKDEGVYVDFEEIRD